MPKLNQIIAIQAGKKSQAKETITEAHHVLKKPELLSGLVRTYQPRDENGEPQPDERKQIQVKVNDLIRKVSGDLAEMFDIVATQDLANCQAKADVVVDGRTLLKDVPVTHLLFLEKQMVDLRTFIDGLPTLDPAEDWEYKPEFDSYVCAAVALQPHQESAEEPRQGRGHERAPRPGRDVHGRRVGRHVDDDEILRRHPGRDAQRHGRARA